MCGKNNFGRASLPRSPAHRLQLCRTVLRHMAASGFRHAGLVLLTLCQLVLSGDIDAAEEQVLSEGSFQQNLVKPWTTIGGTWRVHEGLLQQVEPGLDDPSKAVLVVGDPEELSCGLMVTAKLRLDAWRGDDQARAGVGLCCDPESGHGLNLALNRGKLQFLHDYVQWVPGCEFAVRTGEWYWLKLCKTPGVLQGKAWHDGEREPDDWMVSWRGFDESVSGYPALLGSSGGPGVKASFVSFEEWRVARVGPNPTGWYAKQSTWQESMMASLAAMAQEQVFNGPAGRQTGVARQAALWRRLYRDFSDETSRRQMAWEQQDGIWLQEGLPSSIAELADRYVAATRAGQAGAAVRAAANVRQTAELAALRTVYYRSREIDQRLAQWDDALVRSLRLAVEDLTRTFGAGYPRGPSFLQQLSHIEAAVAAARATAPPDTARWHEAAVQFDALRAEALLANPLMDFDRLVLVKRADAARRKPLPRIRGEAGTFVGNDVVGFLNGLPINFQGNGYLREIAMDNEIAVLSPVRPDGRLTTLYRPDKPVFVGDLKLHFDADRLLFSSVGSHDRWQIFEIGVDGTRCRQVTPGSDSDVDNYDSCYLPDGRILFASSSCFQSVPCERRCDEVANFCVMNADGSSMRRLCFDQDHNFYPSVMADGRILYTRWEYTDIAHAFTGRLMTMNPDGTGQRAHYGSGSFWPNRIFYARPIPGSPTMFVAIATGHHGTARAGELVLFDVAKGRHQAAGAVQRIPGRGKPVEAVMVDNLVDASWPKFLHPFPLSDKYFLVASRPNAESRWGIYLVDVFDNMLLLREEEGCVLFEPIPVRPSPCSPFPFPPAYYELRRLVRSPGLEGPSVIPVADYHADTNGLVQMLRKGHHGVRLDNGSSTWAFALSAGPISTRPVEAVRAGQKEPSRLGAGRRSVMRIQHRPSGPARRWIRIWRRTDTRTRLELTNVEC